MKLKIKVVLIFVIILGLISVGVIFFITRNKLEVKMQIIQYDAFDKSEKVVKEYEIKVNDSINLKKYEGNNIKILEINKQDVKILRNKVRYEILDRQEEKTRRYTEEVMENVEYGESIPVSIDEQKPFGPCYEMPRYSYSIKFIK